MQNDSESAFVIEFTKWALKDLQALDKPVAQRIIRKVRELRDGLTGDVKALTDFGIGYRLRVGDYRVLFDIERRDKDDDDTDDNQTVIPVIVVRRVQHRREAYR